MAYLHAALAFPDAAVGEGPRHGCLSLIKAGLTDRLGASTLPPVLKIEPRGNNSNEDRRYRISTCVRHNDLDCICRRGPEYRRFCRRTIGRQNCPGQTRSASAQRGRNRRPRFRYREVSKRYIAKVIAHGGRRMVSPPLFFVAVAATIS